MVVVDLGDTGCFFMFVWLIVHFMQSTYFPIVFQNCSLADKKYISEEGWIVAEEVVIVQYE